jgi:hypothetical protein
MNVIIDTSVWSLAFRRSEADLNPVERNIRSELAELIRETRARVIGPVCQELLSGIRERKLFDLIWGDMSSFYEEPLTLVDFRRGAEIANGLRSRGLTAHLVDSLICAVAMDREFSIFTTDEDFRQYSKHIPIKFHLPR